jgi:hypothetical protein
MLPEVVKAQPQARTLESRTPGRAPSLDRTGGVNALAIGVLPLDSRRLACGENVIVRLRLD